MEICGLRITTANSASYASNSPETEVRTTTIIASTSDISFDSGSDKSEARDTIISGRYAIVVFNTTSVTVKQNTISASQVDVHAIAPSEPKVK